MLVLVSYDVSTINKPGQRRLARIAKTCLNYGQRVQNSVFECLVDSAQWTTFRAELLRLYKPEEDSLRFYFLGSNWERKVEHHGAKDTPNLESGTLII
ncbi:CRISPR-associated endonuclease Cas2 [Pontiella sulfatireligans]|uniref:CRISPR-associated endoribonuclease Cas2 n=1 Tax=Pontiella sulfatireligans TaxID=2750658 RepID=A0A6C2UUW4_9BACT|nr:CRISPR-associated endonuclease Cas2 [Pontiella sulfatireligans]VGO22954.1 CRISPR-associated endoribonuclease Cas2 [Pontiella sulfatireligans]